MEAPIVTYSGILVDLANPENIPDCDINIIDIAVSLARECRWSNHTISNYVVAQHCMLMADLVPNEFKLEALMHDAVEAYLHDVPSPLKLLLPLYRQIEDRWHRRLATRFNFVYPYPDIIAEIDAKLMVAESRKIIQGSKIKTLIDSSGNDINSLELLEDKRINFASKNELLIRKTYLEYYNKLRRA